MAISPRDKPTAVDYLQAEPEATEGPTFCHFDEEDDAPPRETRLTFGQSLEVLARACEGNAGTFAALIGCAGGLSLAEVGFQLGMSKQAVGKRLSRLCNALHAEIIQSPPSEDWQAAFRDIPVIGRGLVSRRGRPRRKPLE